MLCHVAWQIVTNILKGFGSFIFTNKKYNPLLGLSDPVYEGTMLFQNVRNYLPT
jgi:hypothetical protein